MADLNELIRELQTHQVSFEHGMGYGRSFIIRDDSETLPLLTTEPDLLTELGDAMDKDKVVKATDEEFRGAFLIGALYGAINQIKERAPQGDNNV